MDEQARAEIASAVQEGMRAANQPQQQGNSFTVRNQRVTHNPVTIAGVLLVVLMPFAGWQMAIANRVAVLESQSTALQSAAVEIAAMKQQITDFRQEFDEWKRDQGKGTSEAK